LNRVEIFGGLGNSKEMKELCSNIKRISVCDVNVLISGESGTGKELAARAIHYQSCRAGKPFIPINCGAVPENLFENELFGHVKGAFTDAGMPHKGVVKEAEGGTLFLDEIGAVSSYIQVKLLRLLQDNEYKPLKKFSNRAEEALISFHWPGNIRELENKIQQAIVLSIGQQITPQDLKLERKELKLKKPPPRLENFKQARHKIISAFEKNYLTKLLNEFNGNVVSAAACAGKSRTALWNMLAKYKLHPKEFRPI